MRLASFHRTDEPRSADTIRIGVVTDAGLLDLGAEAPELPRDMTAFLAAGDAALGRARAVAGVGATALPLEQISYAPLVPRPGKFMALGMNYAAHIAEMGREPPQHQYWFNKQITCVNGARDPIVMPHASEQLDYEGELGFVIGRRCRRVPESQAHEMIAGYCVMNDVSVRDWQRRVPTFTMGKSWDTHGPVGPWLVTPDEVPDPYALTLRTLVNGEVRQASTTGDMVFRISAMIAHLSEVMTLEPGDIFATGTPSGVAAGMDPPRWLRVGDVCRVEIESLGHLENTVIAS